MLALAAVALLLVLGLQILPVGSIDEALSGADCEARGTNGGRGEGDVARDVVVWRIFHGALQETKQCAAHRLREVVARAHAQEVEHGLLDGTRLGLLKGLVIDLATFAAVKGRRLLGHGQHGRKVFHVEIFFIVLIEMRWNILDCNKHNSTGRNKERSVR